MKNAITRILKIKSLILFFCIFLGVFHLYTAFFGVFTAYIQRSIHLGLGLVIAYLVSVDENKKPLSRIYDFILLFATFCSISYLLLNFDDMILRYGDFNFYDITAGFTVMVLVLDFARRRVGYVLPGIVLVFLLYAFMGPYLPGILWHRGYDFTRVIYQISLSTEGIFGIPLGVSANYVFLFVLFGAFLEVTGIGQFYIDLAIKSVGRSPGGPAKASVVASSLFGSVSGSAVANVAGTGSVTIPLMRSVGYKPEFAGAVEAVASTGGQIMPPLMGASAFIMAEILGIPYYEVALGALIPAIIYYGALFAMIHFRSMKVGLSGTDTSSMPSLKEMFYTKWIYFLPLAVLIYSLIIARVSVNKAAVYSVLCTIIVGVFKTRISLKDIISAFETGAKTALVVISSTACAGIVVAIINLTGIGMKFSNVVLALGGSNLLLILIFMMIASMILGMGLPTTPAYLILAVLGAPTIIRMGVDPLAAHLFVFYFGAISMITPPVALACYAASCIARSDFWKTARFAVILGLPGFIVPYMFVYNPSLLFKSGFIPTVSALVTGGLGAVILGAGLAGWLRTRASYIERLILIASGLLLIFPGMLSNLAGFGGTVLVFLWQKHKTGRDLSPETGQGSI